MTKHLQARKYSCCDYRPSLIPSLTPPPYQSLGSRSSAPPDCPVCCTSRVDRTRNCARPANAAKANHHHKQQNQEEGRRDDNNNNNNKNMSTKNKQYNTSASETSNPLHQKPPAKLQCTRQYLQPLPQHPSANQLTFLCSWLTKKGRNSSRVPSASPMLSTHKIFPGPSPQSSSGPP